MSVAVGDIVVAAGTLSVPRGGGKPALPRIAPDGPFVVVGFFGRFAKLRDIYTDPETKDTIEYESWPVSQLEKQ